MPLGIPRTEEERRERHKRIYGEGNEPPEKRLGLGPKYESLNEVLWDLLPAMPGEFGKFTLPLPRGLARKLYGGGRKI
ncbi:MAG: hypothetical protein DRN25_02395 [Thermoplasmata archaeon]|nr:MAG: hypothetical protein DRN25_02395 [Thermoplasmata archaeon]